MSNKDRIFNMSSYLFWDIDKSKLDIDKSYSYIIQRVLEYGEWDDWKAVLDYYGLPRIVEACKSMRTLDPKALAFICTISNTNIEDYRCYTSTR